MLKPIALEDSLPKFTKTYASLNKIKGIALYFIGDIRDLSPYLAQVFFQNEVMYKSNILVSITITHEPFGVESDFDCNQTHGLHIFTVRTGYMEVVDIIELLKSRGIDEKTIFYGIENIVSDKFIWKMYGIIKKISPPFVQFHALSPEKIHGVVTRVVM
jgi:KUP system potassium uptake protein